MYKKLKTYFYLFFFIEKVQYEPMVKLFETHHNFSQAAVLEVSPTITPTPHVNSVHASSDYTFDHLTRTQISVIFPHSTLLPSRSVVVEIALIPISTRSLFQSLSLPIHVFLLLSRRPLTASPWLLSIYYRKSYT